MQEIGGRLSNCRSPTLSTIAGADTCTCTRVRTLFSTKNSRTFQGLSRTHFFHFLRTQEGQNQAHIMPHQMLKVESAPIFVSDTWEALLDKTGNTKFEGLLRPWIFILKSKDFQGHSRRMRTLMYHSILSWNIIVCTVTKECRHISDRSRIYIERDNNLSQSITLWGTFQFSGGQFCFCNLFNSEHKNLIKARIHKLLK